VRRLVIMFLTSPAEMPRNRPLVLTKASLFSGVPLTAGAIWG